MNFQRSTIIAFDTTGSMAAYIDAVRQEVAELIPNLFKDNEDLRLGIVAFGDYCDMNNAQDFGDAYQCMMPTNNENDIIKFVQDLIDKDYAYEVNGDVYYRTRKFDGYGKLSGKNIDDLIAGARIAVGEVKEDPLDFALWKARKEESEIAWESPWGMGRPGWHIECSAMSRKYLGATIDIHAGGEDLQFPHHENEIAQSEACNGKEFARYWMHNGYINIDGVKMSKSLANFKTVRDLLSHYDGEVLRFLILSGHYRGPIDFGPEILTQSQNGLARMRNAKSNLKHLIASGEGTMTDAEKETLAGLDSFRQKFIEVMEDDLNTADAISTIFELVTAINTAVKDGASKEFAEKALELLMELARRDGVSLGGKLTDCGTLVFDNTKQDVHSGGSGCGCSAITLCGYLLDKLNTGKLKKILFCGTGALLSPTSTQQGLPIPGVCHAVCITGGM